MMPIQITLRAARVNIGLTLKEAAEEFEINPMTLGNYERDSSNIPRSFFVSIEKVYGIPVEYIFFGKQKDFFKRMINRKFTVGNA